MPCVAMALAFGGMFASLVLVPLWLQLNLGYTATWAGYVTGFNGVLARGLPRPSSAQLVTKVGSARAGHLRHPVDGRHHVLSAPTFAPGMAFHQLVGPQLAQGHGHAVPVHPADDRGHGAR